MEKGARKTSVAQMLIQPTEELVAFKDYTIFDLVNSKCISSNSQVLYAINITVVTVRLKGTM